MTDPIADMLTRIRNANTAKHDTVDIPSSKMKLSIAKILLDEGYIKSYELVENGNFNDIRVTLKYGADKNEKIISFELGYGFRSRFFTANVNAYYTKWMDKTMYKSQDFSYVEDGVSIADRWTVNMQGVDARHMGVELDFVMKPFQWLDINGMFSLGDWRWDCNANGYFYNLAGEPMKDTKGGIASGNGAEDHAKATFNMDNIHVGGAAQTTAALGVNVRPMKGVRVGLDWNLYARSYADFNVSASSLAPNVELEVKEPWRIPTYSTFDLSAGYSFDFGKVRANLSGNINNLFNQEYIADAYDGGGTWDTAYRVLYGFGRTYTVRLKFSF